MARLPAVPDNATPRLYIVYTSQGQEHTAELRLMMTAGETAAADIFNDMKPLMQPLMHTSDNIRGARFSAINSNVSFPLNVTGAAGLVGNALVPDNKPNFISWTGRSTDGRRVRFTIFTSMYGEVQKYRNAAGAISTHDAITNYLRTNVNVGFTKSGAKAVWNTYVNFGVNSYYQRKARRTG